MWSLEVDIDKYHHLIPVCLLGLPVFEKCNTNNTDNQIMLNDIDKYSLLFCYNLAPTQRGAKRNFACFTLSWKYFVPLAKTYSPPLTTLLQVVSNKTGAGQHVAHFCR